MFTPKTTPILRTTAILLTLTLAALPFAACESNGSQVAPAAQSTPKNEGGIVIEHGPEVVATNDTITLANTFMNVPDGFLTATIIGGWAYPNADAKFGNITARLDITDTPGKAITAGIYNLVGTLEGVDKNTKSATLTLEDTTLQGAPKNVTAESGILDLESIIYTGDNIKTITVKYDGHFRNTDTQDTEVYKLNGSIIVEPR